MGNILLQQVIVPIMMMGIVAPIMPISSDPLWKKAALGDNSPKIETLETLEGVFAERAEKIDEYFKKGNMPLQGMGEEMVRAAYENELDWRLLPAISVRESTGGRQACKSVRFNPFGWDSCKTGFKSWEDAVQTVAAHLGGKKENTADYYAGATTEEILHHYNGSVVPAYTGEVLEIMKNIGPKN